MAGLVDDEYLAGQAAFDGFAVGQRDGFIADMRMAAKEPVIFCA